MQGELETVLRDPPRDAARRRAAVLDTPAEEAFNRRLARVCSVPRSRSSRSSTPTASSSRAASAWASLAANAAEYTLEARISLSASADDTRATVVAADTGRGIAVDTRGRLFERFFRGGERDGDGCGRSIARHAVDSLGGAIHVHEPVEAGTVGTLRLPGRA